ncbi:heme oxygenase 1, chloroplastic-like [Zingiber officinale]|nr:heme oxygenase 1, chloroplastic-like [Zingiber officinale]
MASSTLPISQSQAFCARARLIPASLSGPVRFTLPHRHRRDASYRKPLRTMVVTETTAEMPKKRQASRDRSFVDEMRVVAMRLHTKDQAKEGEKESKSPPVAKWEPYIEGYLHFLVDSKIVYDTLETIIQKAAYPWCKFWFPSLMKSLVVSTC